MTDKTRRGRLTGADALVLAHLDEVGGYVTGRIARDVYGRVDNMRARSARMRTHLLELEGRGLVALIDGHKPAAWVRTQAGSERLEELIKAEAAALSPSACRPGLSAPSRPA